MLKLRLEEIASMADGRLNDEKYSDYIVDTISIDTRTLEEGDMYMPIIGENFDGHRFVENAINKGAIAIFAENGRLEDLDFPVIYVNDTSEALKTLAKNYRETLDIKIIGITGSNGKTSTKDLISTILSKTNRVQKTIGNLNNQIGLPRSILNLSNDTEIGVIEMGTDSPGEIEILTNIAKPDIAIITNIGDSHLEKLKTKENIAKEKLDILDGLSEDGTFIYNLDDPILSSEFSFLDFKGKTLTFGTDHSADYRIKILESNNKGSVFTVNDEIYIINLIGIHQVYNATVAIVVADLLNVPYEIVKDSLRQNVASSMRTELLTLDGFDILNDSYKSNPQSLLSAIETVKLLNGYNKKIAILGDMLELGDDEEDLHREIGRKTTYKDVDYLLLYGPLSRYIAEEAIRNFPQNRVFYFESKENLVDKAKFLITKGTIVLVKASRSMRLEEIIESLSTLHLN